MQSLYLLVILLEQQLTCLCYVAFVPSNVKLPEKQMSVVSNVGVVHVSILSFLMTFASVAYNLNFLGIGH
uniref:Uncharacterized protein n=1 Tax=Rhizophora mucronata TaxID=61149 RepID=A0A2P2QX31_RHIMU